MLNLSHNLNEQNRLHRLRISLFISVKRLLQIVKWNCTIKRARGDVSGSNVLYKHQGLSSKL